MAYRYLFVFTYGRSGSTLLSGYLNSLPGLCIRGENYMALANLIEFYASVIHATKQRSKRSNSVTHPWYGVDSIDEDEVREGVRNLFTNTVLKPELNSHTIGFKEIRIQHRDISDFDCLLERIVEVFCDVKFLFNHRDIEQTAKSKWWKETAHSHSIIRSMDNRLRKSKYSASANVFHVQYEQFISNPQHVRELTNFLDCDFDEEAYRNVLETRHSY